ncbi:MAG: DUF1559 domain-containing protein [Planctomycetota bacterium]|nr:MAG: DUF1559 domain-containing protein [Planctomycetota bacterium]
MRKRGAGQLRQTISLYQCPSDPSQRVGAANYAGNFGYGYQKFGSANGVIVNLNQPLRFSDVTDGMSQTALISECLKGSRDNPNRLSRIWRTPYALQGADQLDQFMTLCRMTAASGPLPTSLRVISWVDSLPATMYTHTLYPNDVSCRNRGNGATGIFSATSSHPGGVNLLFCDGHVSFIPTAIDLAVWRSIGTRHGGESVTGF